MKASVPRSMAAWAARLRGGCAYNGALARLDGDAIVAACRASAGQGGGEPREDRRYDRPAVPLSVARRSATLEGHGHPGPEHDAVQSLLTIVADDGVEGYAFGGVDEGVIAGLVKPHLVGEDPFYRERIWQSLRERQRLHLGRLSDRVLAAVDLALWD